MRKTQQGSALIESALVFLVFASVSFGIVEFGHLAYLYNFVAYAARDGARYAIVRGAESPAPCTPATVGSYIAANAVAVDPAALAVHTSWTPDNRPGSAVRVQVDIDYRPMIPWILARRLTLTSTSQMTVIQ